MGYSLASSILWGWQHQMLWRTGQLCSSDPMARTLCESDALRFTCRLQLGSSYETQYVPSSMRATV